MPYKRKADGVQPRLSKIASTQSQILKKHCVNLLESYPRLKFESYYEPVRAMTVPEKLVEEYKLLCRVKLSEWSITSLNLSHQSLQRCEQLVLPNTLLHLNLEGNKLGSKTDLHRLQLPSNLRELNIQNNPLGKQNWHCLQLPPQLEILVLRQCLLGTQSVSGNKTWCPPATLKNLDMSENHLTIIEIQNIDWECTKQLKILNLSCNHFEMPEGLDLDAWTLPLPKSVEILYLEDCNITLEGKLSIPPSVRKLDLSDNRITMTRMGRNLILPATLQDLDLTGNQLGSFGATSSFILPTGPFVLPPQLQCLRLNQNNLVLEDLTQWKLPCKLTRLELNCNNLNVSGVSTPEQASMLKVPGSLRELGLRFNNLRDKGLRHWVLPPRLQMLHLSGNPLGSEIDNYAIPQTLRVLDLHGCYRLQQRTGKTSEWWSEYLLQRAQSCEGQAMYARVQREYNKVHRLELCRGIVHIRRGACTTTPPLFAFLARYYGARHIRQIILQYWTCTLT